jgi:putative ABC transport system permease protein
MRASDTIRWGVRGIKQRKLRAFLTILGIMIGTAAIIALTSQTAGVEESIVAQINTLGSNTITVRASSSNVILTQSDVNKIALIPGVSYAVPEIISSVKIYGVGGTRTVTLIGVDQDQFDNIVSGATFSSGGMYQPESYSEIIIGQNIQYPEDLNTAFLTPGQSVTIEYGSGINAVRTEVQIVGALDPYGSSLFASVDDSAYMSLSGAMTILQKKSYNIIYVKTTSVDNVDSVVNYLKALYGNTLNIQTTQQITSTVSSIIGTLSLLLGAIAGISLFVAGVGIMNIMFVSVMERTKEIGVLKALGFKKNNILSIFLSEAAILGIVGGISGILLGIGLSYLVPILLSGGLSSSAGTGGSSFGPPGGVSSSGMSGFSNFSYSPVFSPETVILVFLFSVIISVLAGFYPARRASRMDPVVALRHD